MQKNTISWLEAITNSMVGFLVNILVQVYVFRYFGIVVPLSSNVAVALLFMVLAIFRGYIIRRTFNYMDNKKVSAKIKKIKKEGIRGEKVSQKQAVAVAINMVGKKKGKKK